MRNLTAHLGGPQLWVKREDLTGLAFGGNKIRKLELLCGEARAQGADTLLITGAVQSNYVRSAAAAARTVVGTRVWDCDCVIVDLLTSSVECLVCLLYQ